MASSKKRCFKFIKRWKIAHQLQARRLEQQAGAENAVVSFLWACRAACAVLGGRHTLAVTLPVLKNTLARLQALPPQDLSLVKREAWANLPMHEVKTILEAALQEADFVYLFFSRQYPNTQALQSLPLLEWRCSRQNPFLSLRVFSQIREHWPEEKVSWLGFFGPPAPQDDQPLCLAPSFSGIPAQCHPLRLSLAKARSLTLRFALGELLRQEQQILRNAFQHVSQLPQNFPPPTVDLFRVFLRRQPNPRRAFSFVASIDKALLKSTLCARKMKVLSRFVNSKRPLAVLLKAELDAKRLYLGQMVSVQDRRCVGEVYAPAKQAESCAVAWDRFARREVNVFFGKVKTSRKKWLEELEEHLYPSDSDSEGEAGDSGAPDRPGRGANRPMGFYEDDSDGEPEEKGGPAEASGAGVKPPWCSHLQSLLSSESTPQHKNFRVLVTQTLKNMLLCCMKNQFMQLDRFGDRFRFCNRNIKRVATQLGLRSVREEEEKHLRSVQKQLDLLLRRSAPMFSALDAGAPQLKSNFEMLLNYKKRFVVKTLVWFFLGRGVARGGAKKKTELLSADLVLSAALQAFDRSVFEVMREECQSLLEENLYEEIGEWVEKIQASQAVLERTMHAWRVPLPSSPDSQDMLWKHLQAFPWQAGAQELEALLPPALDLQSWKTVDPHTGKTVGAVSHWKKGTHVRRELHRKRWKKSLFSTPALALAQRISDEISAILRGTSARLHPRVFIKHWVQTELLFVSLANLEASVTA